VLGECLELVVEHNGARRRIVVDDQGTRVVEEDFFGHPAKLDESALQSFEPALLPLIAERRNVMSARIGQRGHKQIGTDPVAVDLDQALAKVDRGDSVSVVGKNCRSEIPSNVNFRAPRSRSSFAEYLIEPQVSAQRR